MNELRAPFPWYGGKSRVASAVWQRLGDPDYYIEPFAGSLAVLLSRPSVPRQETVNDADCLVTNFWRAAQRRPQLVVRHALAPLNEMEMRARHRAIQQGRDQIQERLTADPQWCDARFAGWWLHGVCASFGEAWLHHRYGQKPSQKGNGLLRRDEQAARLWMTKLRDRLKQVRVCVGDWLRVLTPIEIGQRDRRNTTAAILLDPPYANVSVTYGVGEKGLSSKVRKWAIEHCENERLRIALCGYDGEHEMPASWECLKWASIGGLARNRRNNEANRFRERIWFSPGCFRVE